MLTYCPDAFNILPIIGICSPTKQCGKTTLEEILQGLTNKGLCASNLTPAAVFRTVEKYSPTLLIDEADTFLKNNDELRGIINSGHTKASAFVIRIEGEGLEPVKFSTWGPKAIAMIGVLPETIGDRSIIIRLRRKKQSEHIIKTGIDFIEEKTDTRSMCKRWAMDNFDAIRDVNVRVPPSGNDRQDDNWFPLFKIAEVVGGDWPVKVKNSMTKLVNVGNDEAIGTKLLLDIKTIFEDKGIDRIFSKDLVGELKDLTESPWADWNRGKGLTTNAMARILKPFSIEPKTMRIEFERFKGYTVNSFSDSFFRYLSPISTVTPGQVNDISSLGAKQTVTSESDVTVEKHDKDLNLIHCHVVTDEISGKGKKKEKSPCLGCKARDPETDFCHAKSVFEGKTGPGIPCEVAVKNCEI
jgi:hypothetical protein